MDRLIDRVDNLEKDVGKLFARLAVVESDIQNIYKKLDKIDSNVTWILRIAIGAIVYALLDSIILS